ncbi:Endoribonuclease Dicer [Sarcoptes scabiei]|uniref:Endoribonuclease Dicer n=1 Tax=Sarcoptes scabiei TaxID=52283 RepID=A0A834VDL6_SARSC|nr:Endoribonuclease Dicer [Sarcoptes scabiei]
MGDLLKINNGLISENFSLEKSLKDEDVNELKFSFQLYAYQSKVIQKGVKENLIICLPTGSGKTLIAISIINSKLSETKGRFPDVARRTFFLAPKKVLVHQQYILLKETLAADVLKLTGDDLPENYSYEEWQDILGKHQVFAMTPSILLEIIQKGFIKTANINLIVFDEMHWAFTTGFKPSNHAYAKILKRITADKEQMESKNIPSIIGLSACVIIDEKNLESIHAKIEKIEKFFNAKIETGDYSDQLEIHEQVIPFSDFCFDHDIGFDFLLFFSKLSSKKYSEFSFVRNFLLEFQRLEKILRKDMGIWFAIEFGKICCKSLKSRSSSDFPKIFFKIFKFVNDCIRNWLQNNSFDINDPKLMNTRFVSSKINALFNLILKHREDFEQNSMMAILFVNERSIGNLLYRWFKRLAKTDVRFHSIRVCFVCGSMLKNFIEFESLEIHHCDYFHRIKNKEYNLILATSVFEEGIDLPACNMIIRFDGNENYRSYIQSRGRARSKQSFFYIFTPKKYLKSTNEQLERYHFIDSMLQKFRSHDFYEIFQSSNDPIASILNDQDDQNDSFDDIEPFVYGDAILSLEESINLLNKYFQRLPKDFFTNLKLPFILLTKQDSFFSPTLNNLYAAIFLMPNNSNHFGKVIKGAFFPKKRKAIYHCAFRVCKFLIKNNEIDKHLNIPRSDFIIDSHHDQLNVRYRHEIDEDEHSRRE